MKISNSLKQKLKQQTPRWIVLGIDVLFTIITFFISYFVVWQSDWQKGLDVTFPVFLFTIAFYCLSFTYFKIYRGFVRYTGLVDILKIVQANVVAFTLSQIAFFALRVFYNTPFLQRNFTLLVVHLLLTVTLLVILRIVYKYLYEFYIQPHARNRNILIYGAGSSGIVTLNSLTTENPRGNHIVAFVDDNKKLHRNRINGVKVISPSKVTQEYINLHHIDEIIISIQNIGAKRLNSIIEKFDDLTIPIKIVPPIEKWINGDLQAKQIKQVNIEDLLIRTPIKLKKDSIKQEVNGKVVLVTGAAGSIGSEIARQLFNYNCKRIILLDQAESDLYDLQQECFHQIGANNLDVEFVIGDIRNPNRVETVFEGFKPDIVFHAAAYKHVPLMEDNPYEAVTTNIKGTKLVADAAARFGVQKFVMVSSDKAVNPTNVMGATKRVAELYVSHLAKKSNSTSFVITRFGNVLGSNGSVIPLFRRQIMNGGPLTVTNTEVTRFFMTIPEACQLVLEAGAMAKGGEIYVFDMGDPIKIYDLAKRMIKLSGLKYPEDIDIKVVGLRPGEKIYEELLANGEDTQPTHNEKILIAHIRESEVDNFDEKIDELISMEKKGSQVEFNLELVKRIKELVAEYISQNSLFTELDDEK